MNDNCKERYNEELGATLDITSDGGLLVGCPNSDVIYYYTRPTTGTGSYTLVQNITASEDVDTFGYDGHVALGGENDNILAVASGSSKKLFVFTREGHTWTEVAVVAAPRVTWITLETLPYLGTKLSLHLTRMRIHIYWRSVRKYCSILLT